MSVTLSPILYPLSPTLTHHLISTPSPLIHSTQPPRHLESSPRLAAKYLTHPATLAGRKFDLRYYVIVTSLQPLVLHRHEMFSIRLANHEYSCDDLEQVQGLGLGIALIPMLMVYCLPCLCFSSGSYSRFNFLIS